MPPTGETLFLAETTTMRISPLSNPAIRASEVNTHDYLLHQTCDMAAFTFGSVDVVIVGAGLIGLQAALDVRKAGLSYVVLEARDRVGRKTLSQRLASGKGVVDLGAAWLNEVTQPKIYALAKYGFETVVQPSKGDGVLEDTSGTIQRFADGQLPDVS